METKDGGRAVGGEVVRSSEFAGLRLIDSIYRAKTKVPKHAHPNAVLCIGLTGMCRETFASRVRQYRRATVQFLPAGHSHALEFPFENMRAFGIEIDARWTDRAREFSLRLDDSVHSDGGSMSALMMKIYEEFDRPDSASPLAIEGLAMETLAAVSRYHTHYPGRGPQRWLMRAEEMLRESFTEHLSLTQIASAVGVHHVYLAREFRRSQGCTVGEYIRRLRIDEACRQITTSQQTLTAIATGAGFSDQSHFSRTFKRLIGMTPTDYKRKAR